MGTILTAADLVRAQQIAQALLRKAVNDEHGRTEQDAFYQIVTEGRDVGAARAGYSSCGDLAHWLLRCLGVRAPWVNRNDDGDGRNWKVGVNLNWLCPRPIGPCSIASPHLQGDPAPGDIIVQNNAVGGHVICVIELRGPGQLVTAEYGQPGGKRKERAFPQNIISHLRLVDALPLCQVPPYFGPLQDFLTGEELDALGDDTPGGDPVA